METPTDRIFNDVFARLRWSRGPTEKEIQLLDTMDFFSQHILVSGDESTGKTTTILAGLSAFFLSQQLIGNDGNVDNNDDDNDNNDNDNNDNNDNDDNKQNPDNNDFDNAHKETPADDDSSVKEESEKVEELPTIKDEVPPVNNEVPPVNNEVPPVNNEVPPVNNEVSPVNNEVSPVNVEVPPVNVEVSPVEEEVNVDQKVDINKLFDDDVKKEGDENDIKKKQQHDDKKHQVDEQKYEEKVSNEEESDEDESYEEESYEEESYEEESYEEESYEEESDEEESDEEESDEEEYKESGEEESGGNNNFGNVRSRDHCRRQHDNNLNMGSAFSIIITYKTATCESISDLLRHLIPAASIVTLTGTANWAVLTRHIINADIIILTYDHLFHFFAGNRVFFPRMKWFVLDEAVSMTSADKIDAINFFLDRHLNRRWIQIIIISRVITGADIQVYRHLVFSNYTRCDMNRTPMAVARFNNRVPALLNGHFRG